MILAADSQWVSPGLSEKCSPASPDAPSLDRGWKRLPHIHADPLLAASAATPSHATLLTDLDVTTVPVGLPTMPPPLGTWYGRPQGEGRVQSTGGFRQMTVHTPSKRRPPLGQTGLPTEYRGIAPPKAFAPIPKNIFRNLFLQGRILCADLLLY